MTRKIYSVIGNHSFRNSCWMSRVYVSKTLEESRVGVLRLYRRCLRDAPSIIRNYHLNYSVNDARTVMKECFRANLHVNDPMVVDTLVFKGESELQECRENWKTVSHVLQYFLLDNSGEIPLPKISRKEEGLLEQIMDRREQKEKFE